MARRKAPIHEMNVVPYIDVMLVLLIIFMVTAPLVQTTTIELPKSSVTNNQSEITHPIKIEMLAKNSFRVSYNDSAPETVNFESLDTVIKNLSFENKLNKPIVYFAASPNTIYGDVIEVADKLHALPDIKVSLLMEKKSTP